MFFSNDDYDGDTVEENEDVVNILEESELDMEDIEDKEKMKKIGMDCIIEEYGWELSIGSHREKYLSDLVMDHDDFFLILITPLLHISIQRKEKGVGRKLFKKLL